MHGSIGSYFHALFDWATPVMLVGSSAKNFNPRIILKFWLSLNSVWSISKLSDFANFNFNLAKLFYYKFLPWFYDFNPESLNQLHLFCCKRKCWKFLKSFPLIVLRFFWTMSKLMKISCDERNSVYDLTILHWAHNQDIVFKTGCDSILVLTTQQILCTDEFLNRYNNKK